MALFIVGSGLGGYLLLKELREQGYDRDIKIITADDGAFYSKPQISNALVQNKSALDLVNINPYEMQSRYSFKLYPETIVTSINVQEKLLYTNNETFNFSDCVLAIGAIPNYMPWDNYSYKINSLSDYARLRSMLTVEKEIAIVGSGLVGCELAADLVGAGFKVHMFTNELTPISKMLPQVCGKFLMNKLIDAGVNWHVTKEFSPIYSNGKVLLNETVSSDLLISALGIRPNVELAQRAGIVVDNGIKVNEYCETSAANIYALGDCANVNGKNLAYVAPIRQCINVLAKKIMGLPTGPIRYPVMPIILKTPMCRTIFVHSSRGVAWDISETDDSVLAKNYDECGKLCGFVLLGDACKHRAELMQACVI